VALLHKKTKRYDTAEELYRQALAIREKHLPAAPSALAESLNNLAMLFCAQDRYADAEPLLIRALEIRQTINEPLLIQSLDNLAVLYRNTGRPAQAAPLENKSATLRSRC